MCGLKCQIIRLESIDPVTAKIKPQHTIIPGSVSKEVFKINCPKWGVKELGEGRIYEKHIYFSAFFTREHDVTWFRRRFVLCISKSHCLHYLMKND